MYAASEMRALVDATPDAATIRFHWESGSATTDWLYPDDWADSYADALPQYLESQRAEHYAHLNDRRWDKLVAWIRERRGVWRLKVHRQQYSKVTSLI